MGITKAWGPNSAPGKVLRESLKERISTLRRAAAKCRDAYSQRYMAEPMHYLANAYDEAAAVLCKHLDALEESEASND